MEKKSDYCNRIKLSHKDSLEMWSKLQDRRLGLDNAFISKWLDIICNTLAIKVPGCFRACLIEGVLVNPSWLQEQTKKDRTFINDYIMWKFAVLTEAEEDLYANVKFY